LVFSFLDYVRRQSENPETQPGHERSPGEFKLGSPSANEVAETILAIAKASQSIAARAKNYTLDEAVVTVDLQRTKEGKLHVLAGGGAGDIYKITLTFTKRQR
jgi:hypothetical protein